jgi:hypothetical protein
MVKMFLKKYSIERKGLWISAGVGIKIFLYVLLYYLHITNYNHSVRNNEGKIKLYLEAFDTKSYILPAENLLSTGVYIETFAEPLSKVIRMPGYSLVYLLFRIVTESHTAKNLLIILQLVLSGASCYYLAYIAYIITKKNLAFYIVFCLYAFSVYVSMYDAFLLTESLSTSSIIFSLFFVITSIRKQVDEVNVNYTRLFLAGCWITLAIFMRPATSPLLGLIVLYIIISATNGRFVKARLTKAVYATGIFLAVFLIAESVWLIRNYATFSKVIPWQYNSWVQKTGNPTKDIEFYSLDWIKALGEDCVFYEYNTLSSWLYDNSFCSPDYQLPAHIYTAAYTQDSLYALRDRFLSYNETYGIYSSALGIKYMPKNKVHTLLLDNQVDAAIKINSTFERYTLSYIEENSFDYYFTNRLRLLKKFLVHSGVGALPLKSFGQIIGEHDIIELVFKLSWAVIYWIVLIGGLAGAFCLVKILDLNYLLISLCALYAVLIFPFIIRIIDTRFLCMAYPFLAVLSGVFLCVGLYKIQPGKRQKNSSSIC